jgi:hypothetical protein
MSKAAEQLCHDKPSVRVVGVYAMAELANDWDSGRQLCIDVLCAYVRMPYQKPEEGEREFGAHRSGSSAIISDRRSAEVK